MELLNEPLYTDKGMKYPILKQLKKSELSAKKLSAVILIVCENITLSNGLI